MADKPDRVTALILLVLALLLETPLTRTYFWPGADGFMPLGCPIGDDFVNGWASIRLAASDRLQVLFHDRQYTPAISELFGRDVMHHLWSYPPTALLLFLPFLHIGYFPALAIWTAVGLVAYFTVARLYLGPGKWLAMAMLVAAPSTWITLLDGQNGFITAALFIGACLSLKARPALAGGLLGLLTFKPQLGLIMPFALPALRAWRAILFACIVTVAFAAASVAAFGWDFWVQYVAIILPDETAAMEDFTGFFTGLIVSLYGALRHGGMSSTLSMALQSVCILTVIVLSCRALPRCRTVHHRTLILATAAPLMTPYVLNYDLPLMSLPLAGLLFNGQRLEHWRRGSWAAAWLTPVLVMWLGFSYFPAGQVLCPIILLTSFAAAITFRPNPDA
jgi:hypothetical protein